jgi:hypothetical protein
MQWGGLAGIMTKAMAAAGQLPNKQNERGLLCKNSGLA